MQTFIDKNQITAASNGSVIYFNGTKWDILTPDTAGVATLFYSGGATTYEINYTLENNSSYMISGRCGGTALLQVSLNNGSSYSTSGYSSNIAQVDTTTWSNPVSNTAGLMLGGTTADWVFSGVLCVSNTITNYNGVSKNTGNSELLDRNLGHASISTASFTNKLRINTGNSASTGYICIRKI